MSAKQPWTWEQTILVLDAYFSGANPTPKDSKVKELAELLPHPPSSVAALLRNFCFLDPKRDSGLRNFSKTTGCAWEELGDDRKRLQYIARVIRKQNQESGLSQDVEWMNDVAQAPEGKLLTRFHLVRERNPRLVKRKKERVLKSTGRLACEACEFDFAEAYGDRGKGFIECHHTRAVSDLKPGTATSLKDLVLLCSNCHRMVHLRQPWLSMKDLVRLLA